MRAYLARLVVSLEKKVSTGRECGVTVRRSMAGKVGTYARKAPVVPEIEGVLAYAALKPGMLLEMVCAAGHLMGRS